MVIRREDDFVRRRQHLAQLSEAELEQRFWQLTEAIVQPLIELAEQHSTPSIERSVLLRMGFNSLEARAIVEQAFNRGLLGKGAGHLVLLAARHWQVPYLEAGRRLAAGEGWELW